MTDKPAKKFLFALYVPMNNPAQCELQTVQQTVKILNQTVEFLLKSIF